MMSSSTISPEQAYQEYYGPAIFEPLAQRLLGHARPRPGEALLDIACGTGIVTRAAAQAVGETRIVGLDLNPAMLEVARAVTAASGLKVEWRQGDATAIDFPDAAFDLVLCQQGLQFFSDRATATAEMRRLLSDAGKAAIAVWQGLESHPLYAALADAEVPQLARFGVPVSYEDAVAPFALGNPDELTALLHAAGFSNVEVVQDSIVARFPDADRFVERLEYAYAAVVPEFMDDPAAFATYLAAIQQGTKDIVADYRVGDHIVVPMHANIAIAHV